MIIQPIIFVAGYTAAVTFTLHRYASRKKAYEAKNALLGLLTTIEVKCKEFSQAHPNTITIYLNLIEPAKEDLLKMANALLHGTSGQVNLHAPISTTVDAFKTMLYGKSNGNTIQIPLDYLKLVSTLDQISGEAAVHVKTMEAAASSTTLAAGVTASFLAVIGLGACFDSSGNSESSSTHDAKDEF